MKETNLPNLSNLMSLTKKHTSITKKQSEILETLKQMNEMDHTKKKTSKDKTNTKDKKMKDKELFKALKTKTISLFGENSYNWKAVALFQRVMKNSSLDPGFTTLSIYKDGRIEYIGSSPVGRLIILCFLNNPTIYKRANNELIFLEAQPMLFPRTEIKKSRLNDVYFINQCIEAYFEHFSYFFPVVDEELHKKNPHPLVHRTIVSIGYRYLADGIPSPKISALLDKSAMVELKNSMLKPTVELVTACTLITQYQSFFSETERFWVYQSNAIHISKALGLDLKPNRKLKLSVRKLRNRANNWCACSIQDKIFASVHNRPYSIEVGSWVQPSPKFPPLGNLDECPTDKQRKEVMERASFIYWRGQYLTTELLASITKLKNDSIQSDKALLYKTLQHLLISFERFNQSHHQTMKLLWNGKPKWVYQICEKFLGYHAIFLNNLVLEACEMYLKIPNTDSTLLVRQRALIACNTIILSAESLGEHFCRYGIVYRLYCLSHAVLTLAKAYVYESDGKKKSTQIIQSGDSPDEPKVLKLFIEKGLIILHNTKPFFSIAEECFNTIITVLTNPY